MNTLAKVLAALVALSIVAASGFAGGIVYERFFADDSPLPGVDTAELRAAVSEVSDIIERSALEPSADTSLTAGAISGMLESLDDPYALYFDEQHYEFFNQQNSGAFYGIGITITNREDDLVVVSVIEETPAERAGLLADDVIVTIDGETRPKWDADEAVSRIRGEEGTDVTLGIRRGEAADLIEFTITRAKIDLPNVEVEMLEDGVGYIRLKDFTHTSAPEVAEAWAKLEKQGMKKLVFDLRANPGGLLDQAIAVSDFFLRKGEKVVITRGRQSSSEQVFTAPGRNTKARIPVVVLINKGSASAAEIVAGAVQDQDRGVVAGQTSWGKGLVQSVYTLSDGAGLALTTAKYYTPSGRCIQRDYKEFIEYVTPADEEDGEEDAAPEAAKKGIYRTAGGRAVYGGGGITPDVVVKSDRLSRWMATLYARGVFFEWAVQYRAKNPDVPRDFKVTDAVREEFFAFADGRPNAAHGLQAKALAVGQRAAPGVGAVVRGRR